MTFVGWLKSEKARWAFFAVMTGLVLVGAGLCLSPAGRFDVPHLAAYRPSP